MHKIAIGVLTWRATEVPIFKRFLRMLPAVCLAMGMARAAENPFIGEWKLDPSKSRLPDEMKVESEGGNKYTFDFGAGTERIVVDGTDQPGNGGTLLSVNAEASDTWIVERKKDGRLLIAATWNIPKDGRTLTDYFRGFQSDGSTLSMDYVYQRIGGGSGFAADWRSIKETINSPYSIRVKEYQRDGLSLITPSQTKNVKFDGEDYPNEGPNAERGASASIRRVDERALVLTDKINGKGGGYRGNWGVTRSEDFDDHRADSRPRQSECDGVRAEVGRRSLARTCPISPQPGFRQPIEWQTA